MPSWGAARLAISQDSKYREEIGPALDLVDDDQAPKPLERQVGILDAGEIPM